MLLIHKTYQLHHNMNTHFIRRSLLLLSLCGALLLSSCFHTGSKGYEVNLPNSAQGVYVEQLTEEEAGDLDLAGCQIIVPPIRVYQDGNDHVQLSEMATVSFDIPEDIPREDYHKLMGVLVTDGRPLYYFPSFEGFQNGQVSFETSHFCIAGAMMMDDDAQRRKLFADRVAINGWDDELRDSDLEKTMKEKLVEFANQNGFGEYDYLGIAVREVFADNQYVKDALSLMDGEDPLNYAADKVAERMEEELKALTLGRLIEKFKENPNNEDLKNFLDTHLTQGNVEDWSKQLMTGKSAMEIARDYAKNFVVDELKNYSTKVCPLVTVMQASIETNKVIKKCWSINDMHYIYEEYYKKNANNEGKVQDDVWESIEISQLAACISKYGMNPKELRKSFEERYKHEREIQQNRRALEKIIQTYEETPGLLEADIFTRRGYDYAQRMNKIHQLVERFRKELVGPDGDIPGRWAHETVNEVLCKIAAKYLELYPDTYSFNQWLEENGYTRNKFKKDVDAMDQHRCWWLVDAQIDIKEDVLDEHSVFYSASETHHQRTLTWNGKAFIDPNDNKTWYRPYTFVFTADIEAPPERMAGGDSIVLHTVLNLTGEENGWYNMERIVFDFDAEDVGWGYIREWNMGKAINLVGSREIGTRYGMPNSGEWDYVLHIPKGRKDELKAINFDACGARTHWVYKWTSIFEKETLPDEEQ